MYECEEKWGSWEKWSDVKGEGGWQGVTVKNLSKWRRGQRGQARCGGQLKSAGSSCRGQVKHVTLDKNITQQAPHGD